MQIIIFCANCNDETVNLNCSYTNQVLIDTPEILQKAVRSDHLCAEFKGNNRNTENFLRANVLVMEIDNEYTEKQEEWITPEKLNELLPDISNAIVSLKGRTAKPKFRVYFQITEKENFDCYEEVGKEIKDRFGFLGGTVLDIRNPIFGVEADEVIWHDGKLTIDRMIQAIYRESLKPEDYSDLGEAKTLASRFGAELKFSTATGLLHYDGKRWVEDETFSIGAIQKFLDLQLKDAKSEKERAEEALINTGISKSMLQNSIKNLEKIIERPEQRALLSKLAETEEYFRFVMKYRDNNKIKAVGETVKPMVQISTSDLDKDEFLLNTPDATYDLRKGLDGKLPHNPNDLITKITACSPGDTGKQLWLEVLERFFSGNQELIDYVQLVIGLAAIGKVFHEVLIIAYGDGANGKSTFWNAIFKVLGDYAGKISSDALTMSCTRNTMPELATLRGLRFILSTELKKGEYLNDAIIKQVCSTDDIQAEEKYKAPFHFTPSHTLVLCTNHLPWIKNVDGGILRRLLLIPFQAKISACEDIKNYADYLYKNAGSFILKWVIEGAQKVIALNYKIQAPKVVRDAFNTHYGNTTWLDQFVTDCCVVGKTLSEKSGALYKAYQNYCSENGELSRSTRDFYSTIEAKGYFKNRTSKGVIVHGLSLKENQNF